MRISQLLSNVYFVIRFPGPFFSSLLDSPWKSPNDKSDRLSEEVGNWLSVWEEVARPSKFRSLRWICMFNVIALIDEKDSPARTRHGKEERIRRSRSSLPSICEACLNLGESYRSALWASLSLMERPRADRTTSPSASRKWEAGKFKGTIRETWDKRCFAIASLLQRNNRISLRYSRAC